MSDPNDPLARFAERLSLPLIAAPMFLVSGVDLVVAACGRGVIGSFPPLTAAMQNNSTRGYSKLTRACGAVPTKRASLARRAVRI